MSNCCQIFLYTIEEYKRFAKCLPVQNSEDAVAAYTEMDYVGVQVRLMLLRKYFSNNGNVSFRNIIKEATEIFPDKKKELNHLSLIFDEIESQQFEHILADGTKIDIYKTIECVIYGLYLHADEEKIAKLEQTRESIRFFSTRKYLFEIEELIFKLYDFLKSNGTEPLKVSMGAHSPVIYLGNPDENVQAITRSPYWNNLYGHNSTDDDINKIQENMHDDDVEIFAVCIGFVNEAQSSVLNIAKLRSYVFPQTYGKWRNFEEVRKILNNIPDIGFSSKIRYNKNRDTAYVRLFPNVREGFVVSTPHVIADSYEFELGIWAGMWLIHSFRGDTNSICKTHSE